MARVESASVGREPVLSGGRGMSTDLGGGSRTLKSMNSLISATLACAVLAALTAAAGYLIDLNVLYIAAAALALAAAVPCFLMFQRVKAVEADMGHREALSLAQ